jgi:hypothetical protein
MRKLFYLFVAVIVYSFNSLIARANVGDTTWVQANHTELHHDAGDTNWYGSYDTAVAFPHAGTYRKIFMIFTLGKYQCHAGSQYCYQWDYTVQNYLLPPNGDTLELGRFITPYSGSGDAFLPFTWTYKYVYDVTDFAAALKDNARMRIFFSGYSGGFTGDIKFAFIEGTPERNTTGYKHLWGGSFQYGNAADPINNHFSPITQSPPTGTQSADLKFTVTGHGYDANQCCEFAQHNYQVVVNNTPISNTLIWKDDCGANEIYPQTGTWIYNRANWCPGSQIGIITQTLPGVAAGANYNVGITFDAYSAGSNYGSYTTDAVVVYHGALNHTNDAAIEDIIAPSNSVTHFRENPLVGAPTIKVRNSGSAAITSLHIKYGVVGTTLSDYTWQGTLSSLQDSIIVLPELNTLRQLAGGNGLSQFSANIVSVNGNVDEDTTNNRLTSYFVSGPLWPQQFVVSMLTNSQDDQGNDQTGTAGTSQTNWQIFDRMGHVVASRMNASTRTQYNDTVTLGFDSYKLVVQDAGCDGLNWWVYAQDHTNFPNYKGGSIGIKKVGTAGTIALNGNIASGTYNNDFGCGFTQYFTTTPWNVAVVNVTNNIVSINAYPNPATSTVTISLDGFQQVKGTLQLIDAIGRVVFTQSCTNAAQTINVAQFTNGLYTLVYIDDAAKGKIQTRLLIAK